MERERRKGAINDDIMSEGGKGREGKGRGREGEGREGEGKRRERW